ncbi:MAG: MbnP family copper-binding protein [Burkholderiaceae bacterium]
MSHLITSHFSRFCRPALRPLLALALPLALSACGGGGAGDTTTPSGPQSIRIDFAAKAGAQDAKCGTTLTGLGADKVSAELNDLRFYVSQVALINDKGESVPVTLTVNDWQTKDVALIDLEDGTGACATQGTQGTNAQIVGTVAAGSYKGIQMTVGVPSSLNHTDYAVASKPMDIQALAWSWQAGRKFAKIEVNPVGGVARPAPTAAAKTFNLHLGSTGCTGNPATGETVNCARPNRMTFSFANFNAATDKVVLDVAALFAGSTLGEDRGGAVGCMSGATDPECDAIFKAMKLDLVTGVPINAGAAQTVFKVEAK